MSTYFHRPRRFVAAGLGTAVLVLSVLTTSGATAVPATGTNGITPGTLIVGAYGNNQVVAVTSGGTDERTLGGPWTEAYGVAVDSEGDVFVSDDEHHSVTEIPADGGPQVAIGAGAWSNPEGIAVDPHGNVYGADAGSASVLEIPAGGGNPISIGPQTFWESPSAVAVDSAGDVFVTDTAEDAVVEIPDGGGVMTPIGSGWERPEGIAVDPAGNVFVADADRGVIEVPANGDPQKSIGTGLWAPFGVAVDPAGDVYIADLPFNRVDEVTPDGTQTTLPVTVTKPLSLAYYDGVTTPSQDPVITAQLASAHARTRDGWYRSPVHVRFTCQPRGSALLRPCPRPITISHNERERTVSRTIHAVNGGVGTVVVRDIHLDQTAPVVREAGVKNGEVYRGSSPRPRCVASDNLSGVASCVTYLRRSHGVVHYRLRARDKAGNAATIAGRYDVVN